MGRAADPDEATTQPLRRLPCDAQSPLGPSAEAELLRVFAHLPSLNAWSEQSQAGAPASLCRCFSRALSAAALALSCSVAPESWGYRG